MDFKRFKSLDILEVADWLNVELTRRGKSPRGVCPCCGRNSFALTPKLGLFFCFKCKRNGDPLELTVQVKNLSYTEAAKELAANFSLPP